MSDRLPTPRDLNMAEGTFSDDRSDSSLSDYGKGASQDRHKASMQAAEKKRRFRKIGGALATGMVIAVAALSGLDKSPKNTTENALSPSDIPALTTPGGHITEAKPQQVYDGVHTSDGPAEDSGLETSPEDKEFGRQLAAQNKHALERVQESYEQASGGVPYDQNTGGAEAQAHR